MRSLPGSVPAPSAEVMKGSAPRWQVMRQHPPRASGAQHIADGIHHLPAGVLDGTAAGFGRRQQRFQQLPLPVVQVGGVIWSVHTPRLRHSARSSPSCLYASFYLLRHPLSPNLPAHLNAPYHISSQIEPYFGGTVAVSLDRDGRLYVVETNRHRFQVYREGQGLRPPFLPEIFPRKLRAVRGLCNGPLRR